MPDDASWLDDMPAIYDRCLGPTLFEPWSREVTAAVAAVRPARVLELAAGSGILTAALVGLAEVTATDLNPAMVDYGSQRVAGADWQVADAQDLPFDADKFDLVVCQFGVMFLPDKPAAFAEMRRVLRPGGTALFAVWDTVARSTFTAAYLAGVREVFPDNTPDFLERVPHGYHDVDRIRRDVEAGGLTDVAIERLVPRGSAPSARTIAEGFSLGTPMRFELLERGDPAVLVEDIGARMTARLGAGPVDGDLGGILVTARA